MDRKRKKKSSNEDWQSPVDGDAEITKLKDGRTALAYKAENAVDMETGAIVAVTTHGGAAGDTTTVVETVIEAGIAVADLMRRTPEGKYEVHPRGVEEVVADKGYHSNDVMVGMAELEVRSYVPSRIAGRATGTASRRRRRPFTVTGGGLWGTVASDCSGNGASGSSGTLPSVRHRRPRPSMGARAGERA